MDNEIILGQVCDIWPAGAQQIALLAPLYLLNAQTGVWVVIEDVEKKFPNRGCVTWIKPAEEAIVGSIWTFTYEPHPSFDSRDPRHDRYRINWEKLPQQLREVIDLRAKHAEETFKRVDQGLNLSFIPARSPYVVLDEQTWAGPLRLVQDRDQDRWMLDEHQRKLPIPRVARLPEENLVHLYVDGKRTFLRDNAPVPTKLGELDWAPDHLIIQRLLTTARKNQGLAKSLTLTKATIQQAIEALRTGDDGVTTQQIARAHSYLANLERVKHDLHSFESELLALPAVAERIAQAERNGRESARKHAEAEAIAQARQELERLHEEQRQLTHTIQTQQAQLVEIERQSQAVEQTAKAAVDAEMHRHEAELGALNAQVAERRRQLSDQIEIADAAITQRVAELIAKPAEALAQIALVRAALGVAHPVDSGPSGTCRAILPPASVLFDDGGKVEDQQKLVVLARRALLAAGLPDLSSRPIHAALVAGMVPLVNGAGALEALEQYAHVTVGGRMLWCSVTPTTLEPADLLGRYDASARQFAPHPSGLLDLLIYARQPEQRERLFLAVLDGVNRAAADAYLLPLLTCYRSTRREDARRTLRLAHPGVFTAEDPYFAATELAWPSNVLLAGTITDGAATIPLPPSLWADAFYVDLEATTSAVKVASNEVPPRSSVSLRHWSSWQALSPSDVQVGLEALEKLNVDGVRLPTPIARSFARAYTASRRCVKTSEDALKLAVRGSLVPYALASQQQEALTQVLEVAEIKLDDATLELMRKVLL